MRWDDCSVPGCTGHLRLRKGDPGWQLECRIEGCSETRGTHGWCEVHYQRWRKHGDPLLILQWSEGVREPYRVAGDSPDT